MDLTTCRDLCERWENDYIANKNMLAFGEYDFDYDDYSDLIKQSYYFLKEIFDYYNLSVADLHNSNSNFLLDYAELVSLIKSYGTTENFQDYSEEYLSSMLIAKSLLKTVVCHIQHWTVYFHLARVMQRKTILNTILKKVIFQILSNTHLNFAII